MEARKNIKPMIRKEGTLPVNSRITIDYSGKKPDIKFQYPNKNAASAIRESTLFVLITLAFTVLWLLIFGFFVPMFLVQSDFRVNVTGVVAEPINNSLQTKIILFYNNNNLTTFVEGEHSVFGNYVYLQSASNNIWISSSMIKCLGELSTLIFFFLFIFIGPSLLSRWKWFCKKIPEFARKGTRRYYYKFTGKDLNLKQLTCEIPLFRNIFMDYKATGDFSKYLQRVEIREHPFKMRVARKIKNRKRKPKKNIYLWKATFFFSQVPVNGCIETWFN